MNKIKLLLPIITIFLSIGYAATSITLSITGDVYIASDVDDFNVYVYDVLFDGLQDESLLSGDYTISVSEDYLYDSTTHAIEIYLANESSITAAKTSTTCQTALEDAEIKIVDTTIPAKETNAVVITIYYDALDQLDGIIDCTVEVTPITADEPTKYKIGQLITIENENFNIISFDETTVTALAQSNLSTEYIQSSTYRLIPFSNSYGWDYTPGPKEINIQQYDGNAKTYVNAYTNYVKGITKSEELTGNLITLAQLKELECTISEDYSYQDGLTCENSQYVDWLANGQDWWTRSATQDWAETVWVVYDKTLNVYEYNGIANCASCAGFRPTITMPQTVADKYTT